MGKLSRPIVLALGMMLVAASAAHARNFCFNPGITSDYDHQSLAVVINYHAPRKGSCSPIYGFDIRQPTVYRSVSGTACLNSGGDTLHVNYLIQTYFRFIHHVMIDLNYPTLVGGFGEVSDDGSGLSSRSSTNPHANACEPQLIPVP